MLSSDAKKFVGQFVDIVLVDRSGKTQVRRAELYDIGFLPLYGPCLITDLGELRLDRVITMESVPLEAAA
ncbi:MAG: hypothetical protein KF884_06685 [Fimbriimonadaceae bacterium]|nr:hypothetical protein [Fimbriimonadaceae bacterium]QYK57236.1 MAG: hypothetical protein KF884_06685 [Fimbriimonadaceae bacterium]